METKQVRIPDYLHAKVLEESIERRLPMSTILTIILEQRYDKKPSQTGAGQENPADR